MSVARLYAKTQNETASKERLMVLLFEAALRHMRAAAPALEDLDALAPPLRAQQLFAPGWYDPAATTVIPLNHACSTARSSGAPPGARGRGAGPSRHGHLRTVPALRPADPAGAARSDGAKAPRLSGRAGS